MSGTLNVLSFFTEEHSEVEYEYNNVTEVVACETETNKKQKITKDELIKQLSDVINEVYIMADSYVDSYKIRDFIEEVGEKIAQLEVNDHE